VKINLKTLDEKNDSPSFISINNLNNSNVNENNKSNISHNNSENNNNNFNILVLHKKKNNDY